MRFVFSVALFCILGVLLEGEGILRPENAAAYIGAESKESLARARGSVRKIGEISTGPGPKSLLFHPDGVRLVTALLYGSGVDVFSLSSFDREIIVTLDNSTTGFVEMAYQKQRGELWVSQMLSDSVHVLDGETLQPIRSISTGGQWPKGVEFSPDGKTAYVSHWNSEDVSFLDTETGEAVATVAIPGIPRGIAVSGDGAELYVANFSNGTIAVVDVGTAAISRIIGCGPGAKRHIVIDHTRQLLYASDMFTGRVTVVDLIDYSFKHTDRLGSNPNTIVLSANGNYLFVSIRGKNSAVDYRLPGPEYGRILIIDTDTLEVLQELPAGNQPTGLALSPDQSLLAYSNFLDDTIEVYEISGIGPR